MTPDSLLLGVLIAAMAVIATYVIGVVVTVFLPPRFCNRCGARLEVRKRMEGYEPLTGKPRMVTIRECPRSTRH